MTEQEFAEAIELGLLLLVESGANVDIGRIQSLQEAGLLTKDVGLVIAVGGQEFEVTIQEV